MLGFAATLAAFAALFHFALDFDVAVAVLAAIPFAVISSAVAIPAARGLAEQPREFVIYESSLSDIVGVLVFYAWQNAERLARDVHVRPAGRRRHVARRGRRCRAGAFLFHQPARRARALPAADRRAHLPVCGRQGTPPVAAHHGAGVRPAHQQPAPHHVAHAVARAAQRALQADAGGVQGTGRRAHVRDEELLLPAAGLLDQRVADGVAARRGWWPSPESPSSTDRAGSS